MTSNGCRVALILDDGPDAELTERFLAILDDQQVHVSFGYLGRNVAAHPRLARAASDAGHELINHTYSHPHLPGLDDAAIRREVQDTQTEIQRATGRLTRWIWAPYGHWSRSAERVVREVGMEPFPKARFQVISTEDWNLKTRASQIRDRATRKIVDRTIINFHEWRRETLDEFPAILANLRGQGCQFLTFSALLA